MRVGDLRRDLVQRVVPRRDAADDADRLLARRGCCPTVVLVLVALGQRGRGVERVDRQAGLHDQAQPLRHARLAGDDRWRSRPCGRRGPRRCGCSTCPAPRREVAAQPSNAARAALAALSTSSAVPSGIVPDDLAVGGVEDVDGARCPPTAPRRRRCRSCRARTQALPPGDSDAALRVDAIAWSGTVRTCLRCPRSRPNRRRGVAADRGAARAALRHRHATSPTWGGSAPSAWAAPGSAGPRARPSGPRSRAGTSGASPAGRPRTGWSRPSPGEAFAFETQQSGTRWTYRFEPDGDGTIVTESRAAWRSRPLVAKVFSAIALGGVADHDDEMRDGMLATLERLKAVAEG